MSAETMDCPGCGKPEVSRALVACRSCWRQVPHNLQQAVYTFKVGTVGRVRAVGAVRAWLKANAKDVTP